MLERLINSLLSIITLASITTIPAYAHNLPDDKLETALMHPFVSPDHAIPLAILALVAVGIYFFFKKRTSR